MTVLECDVRRLIIFLDDVRMPRWDEYADGRSFVMIGLDDSTGRHFWRSLPLSRQLPWLRLGFRGQLQTLEKS